ncbi:MAG: guanylate kinase [Burkholderiaceae bacterium]|nr:guanylate kinase [Burkholderiaceae bacterium]
MKRSEYAGSLFVVVAPSGAGKTSMVRALLAEQPGIRLSVSCTTRAPRTGEVDGTDYFFVAREDFVRRRDAGEFIEWAEVHGNFYGTSRAWIEERMRDGDDILLEIDWQGATQVKQLFPEAVGVFIAPPSLQALRDRLERRGTDSPEEIDRRVAAAERELQEAGRFEYVIINQEFATALRQLGAIIEASRCRFGPQYARRSDLFEALGLVGNSSN